MIIIFKSENGFGWISWKLGFASITWCNMHLVKVDIIVLPSSQTLKRRAPSCEFHYMVDVRKE